jgi:hypothetical protein
MGLLPQQLQKSQLIKLQHLVNQRHLGLKNNKKAHIRKGERIWANYCT